MSKNKIIIFLIGLIGYTLDTIGLIGFKLPSTINLILLIALIISGVYILITGIQIIKNKLSKEIKSLYDDLLAKWYYDDVILYFDRFERFLYDDIFKEIREDIYKEILEKDTHNPIDITHNLDILRIRYT